MGLKRFLPLFVRYTLVGGVISTVLLLGGTAAIVARSGGDVVPMLGNVALVAAGVGLSAGAAAFSTNNTGLETVEAGVQGGFDVTDPTSFRTAATSLPGRYRFGALCFGVGGFCGLALVGVAVLG